MIYGQKAPLQANPRIGLVVYLSYTKTLYYEINIREIPAYGNIGVHFECTMRNLQQSSFIRFVSVFGTRRQP